MIILGHVYTVGGLAYLAAVAYGLAQNEIRARRRSRTSRANTTTAAAVGRARQRYDHDRAA
ncbi:hypothetical protein [Nocardia africana]|uniref:Uncharacterized protein n=1 Tax=Nocardia africana TaxID=134964 RepID=A0A378X3E0_9NOCA|nr:hypothetical protein [Nocardia africana]MCC3311485.1 hypothetical protein [Nocardia africana]SUA47254.1 Uncharacterised protein [Nocardia africana]